MNRRNFFGNLLLAGAAFTILPGSGRLWVPDRKLLTSEVASIWQTYYLSRYDLAPSFFSNPKLGEIKKYAGTLWYGTVTGWMRLKPMAKELSWNASQHKGWTPKTGQVSDDFGKREPRLDLVREIPEVTEIPEINSIGINGIIYAEKAEVSELIYG